MKDKIPEDRRVSPRIDSGNLVAHRDVAESDPNRSLGMSVTLDVNEFGLRIQSTDPIPLGEKYRFSIALGDDIVDALGQIVHVNRALNGTFEMGVEFLEIAARNIEKIRVYLQRRSPTS